MIAVERGQDHQPGRGFGAANRFYRAHAVENRHAQIQQGHIGTALEPSVDALLAVGGLRDHDHVRLPPDDRCQPLSNRHVVVGNENAYGCRLLIRVRHR